MTVSVYYLDEPLSGDDFQFVSEEFADHGPIDQIRIPYVLPVLEKELDVSILRKHEGLLRKSLRKLGIAKHKNNQVVLVAPKQLYWYTILLNAVAAETGVYPQLVQTEAQRAAIGNPGGTRLLDTHGLMGLR